jgi:signal transduction histidine kinase
MPGGSIRVQARSIPGAAQIAIEVQDDGPGIPPEHMKRMLTLGLVQDVLTAHGGDLAIESRTESEQSGTTVRLILPVQ